MNILYIWDADYPWDIRVEKICKSLQANGHSVHIASRNLKRRPVYEKVDDIYIHRIRTWSNSNINYILSFPLFFSPIWRIFLHGVIQKHGIEIIIVRDLPMAIAGIWAGKKFKIPVIFDMAEDYTAMIRDIWRARKYQGVNLVLRNPFFSTLVERYAIRNIDHIFVVVSEAVDVVNRAGGGEHKVTIVSNTPQVEYFDQDAVSKCMVDERIISHYTAIYTGGVQMGRGIQTVLTAIPKIVSQIPDFLFVVLGDGYAVEKLKNMAEEVGVSKYVLWLGWVDHSVIFQYIKACRVGVIPHFVTDHVDTTIPNKIFDYMMCGIPVVASDARPMIKIIEDEQCGKTFKCRDPDSLANAIIDIYHSDIDFSKNGRDAVFEKYNWAVDEKRMLMAINRVVSADDKEN